MKDGSETIAKELAGGMGQAVADRTILRKVEKLNASIEQVQFEIPRRDDISLDSEVSAYAKSKNLVISGYTVEEGDGAVVKGTMNVIGNIVKEDWSDVAYRVALGSSLLQPIIGKVEDGREGEVLARLAKEQAAEFHDMNHHLRQASILMSGRHLQHGDETQPERSIEVFTNCSTSAMSFLSFYLLLNGSGVGRAYDDEMMLVDWSFLPFVVPVIEHGHKDVQSGEIVATQRHDIEHFYKGREIAYFEVPDSREGWTKAFEKMEYMAFTKKHQNSVLIMDFSKVRPRGAPIKGMQNRPASGPAPMMTAVSNIAKLRASGMSPWRATMFADHYLAECVLVGGARRAARMATKYWKDETIFDFIGVKQGGFLWSSNNSVTVDQEFWNYAKMSEHETGRVHNDEQRALIRHAQAVFEAVCNHSYHDGTGEPGFINVDKLTWSSDGVEALLDGNFAESEKLKLSEETLELSSALAEAFANSAAKTITNPCVTGDTWVETSEGAKQVSELTLKPYLAQVNGELHQSTAFWKTGDKEVFKIKTNRGQEIKATADHKVLVETSRKRKFKTGFNIKQEWVEVQDLGPGDKLVLNNSSHTNVKIDEEFNNGWLLGEVVGDGGHNPSKYPTYVRFWGESQKTMQQIVFELTGTEGYENNINRCTTVACKYLNSLALGLISEGNKTLLPALEKKSDNFVAGFLRGIFDADGSVQGDLAKGVSVRLWQADSAKVQVIQRMLARFGIISTIYYEREGLDERCLPDGNGGLKKYLCSAGNEIVVSKDNIMRFAEKIGFYEPQKSAKLSEILASRKREPYEERFTADVISIESCGVEAVYDCTVDNIHRFSANGIIVHNCGEIVLGKLGGYCVIADNVPYHATSDEDAIDSFRVSTRALIRTNLMNALYGKEVRRTNRIGVGMTGLHEYAWSRFGFGFRDIIDEAKSIEFWLMLARFKRTVQDEAKSYSEHLGVSVPHTNTTMKPAGTTSKLFGLTEGAHLPSMREYIRWVQFRSDDPLIAQYEAMGYPIQNLLSYSGTTIVGFPTAPEICKLGMGDKLVTAAEATPEEQYQYLRLLEKYWITGVEEDGVTPLEERGNQVSYTLKYNPNEVSYDMFKSTLLEGQSGIRCCSVMPQNDGSAYEYQPEEVVTKARYEMVCEAIKNASLGKVVAEDVGQEHVDCAGGACPISFNENK